MSRPARIREQLQPGGTPSYHAWRAAVRHAEDIGTDLIFGYDHFHLPSFSAIVGGMPQLDEIQPDVNNFEGWTALATWGEITHRAEIGLLVSGMGYRNPGLLADMARTVDHISGGRLVLGVGSGLYEKDYTTYGYDFRTVKSRSDLFDKGLDRTKAGLNQFLPPPMRPIPILIGGSGTKRTIPAVARHADIWHTFLSIDDFRKASALVDHLATEAGRSGNDIERSVAWFGAASADESPPSGQRSSPPRFIRLARDSTSPNSPRCSHGATTNSGDTAPSPGPVIAKQARPPAGTGEAATAASDTPVIEIVLGLRQALGREAHGDKAIDLCNGGDPVCSSGNDVRAHSVYLEDGLARQAATFVAQRLTAAGSVARELW